MILIADSGSTKTDWCLADETQTIAFKTAGINPFFQTDDEIRKILSREVLERLPVTDITEDSMPDDFGIITICDRL